MVPPVDPSVLKVNPNFSLLYKDLCTRKLNPDGSTRNTKKQRMHDEIRRNLTHLRTAHHKTNLLIQTLSTLPSKSPIPPALHPPIALATAHLTGQISPADRAILAPDMEVFLTHISTISEALSTHFTAAASLLCTIAHPANSPAISALPSHAQDLYESATHDLPAALAAQKIELANATRAFLTLNLALLQTSIRILEQTQHGALARSTKSKAELLHARATVLGLQARIHTHTYPPPAPFVAALKNFRDGQGSSEAKLRDREGLATRALELYAKAGEKGMRDLAKRKEWLGEEIKRMEEEIEALEK